MSKSQLNKKKFLEYKSKWLVAMAGEIVEDYFIVKSRKFARLKWRWLNMDHRQSDHSALFKNYVCYLSSKTYILSPINFNFSIGLKIK